MVAADSTKREAPVLSGRLPIAGHAPLLMSQGLRLMERARDTGPVVRIYLGRKPAYVVNDPDLLRRVLVTDASAFAGKGPLVEKAKLVLGNGISCSTGDFNHRQRRLMQPAFHKERVAGYVDVMRAVATERIGGWHAGERLVMEQEMREIALTVAAKALFASDIGREAVEEFRTSIPVAVRGVAVRTMMPALAALPTPGNRRFDQALRQLHRIIDRMIEAYRRDGVDHGDVLSMLLAARDEETGEAMPDKQIHAEVMTIATAATETTNGALVWAAYELGQREDVERRLHDELTDVLSDRPVTAADLPKLEYTRRFLNEVLRLYAMWVLTRQTTRPTELAGIALPAGATVMFSPQAIHRDPRIYRDPTRFDPDRWLPERAEEVPRNAFLPFGSGRYICIGEQFAMTEMLVVFATLVRRWRLRPVPGHVVKPSVAKGGLPNSLPMVVEPRHH
ncbi:cytochrome P450 [Micromonospora sp. NPDC050686]|uniref:cytochrome P450 n=1 Tax=Micromonospora sp. NPDC050686 TaxID=3154631 RepID=UPI0033DB7F34